MYTSILVLALSGLAPSADAGTPAWLTDYSTAIKESADSKKPVMVVLGSGANGWQKLSREGSLSAEAQQSMASRFVCVHVDTATDAGKRLAKSLELPTGVGIVISDRKGELMAFHHEGDLANADLLRYLARYGDPQYVVRTTETNPSHGGRGGHGGHGGGYTSFSGSCSSCSSCSGGHCRRR